MDYHGLSWTIMDYHGLSWTIMDYQGLSGTIMDYHDVVEVGVALEHANAAMSES